MIKLQYPNFWAKKGILSTILIPLSWIYIFLGFIRKIFTKQIKLDAKVICVGNITVGGTGKTQIVLWLAKILQQRKLKFVIITKGYNSKLKRVRLVTDNDSAREVGDESLLLRNAGTVIAARKIKYALPLIRQLKPEIIIVDDGMQNPGFHKDMTIVTIDAARSVGNGRILPAGCLRETIKSALKKADIFIAIGNNEYNDVAVIGDIQNHKKPYFNAQIKLEDKIDKTKKYLAFSGIGNPQKFFSLLKQNGVKVAKSISYPDHYIYNNDEIDRLIMQAKENNYQLITTAKDYVKMDNNIHIKCANVALSFDNEKEIIKLIDEKIL